MRKIILKRILFLLMVVGMFACQDFLEKYPSDELSEPTFWRTEKDATLALTGVYHEVPGANWNFFSFWMKGLIWRFDLFADNGNEKDRRINYDGTLTPAQTRVASIWGASYNKIARCNNFLTNIGNVEMPDQKKNEMIAEVRFIRAYFYYYMSQLWGGVPLVTEVLGYEAANTISRSSKSVIVNFALTELAEAASSLPVSRPNNEYGRVTKGAALAIQGRLLMAEQKWTEAAQIYKQIMDLGIYQIDPRYKELFEYAGEKSKEVVHAFPYLENVYGDDIQKMCMPAANGGWHQVNAFNNLVEEYEMIDGKTTDESPLFDPNNPYLNRDPRLYMTVLLSRYHTYKGKLYDGHPDSKTTDVLGRRNWSGLLINKYLDHNYTGNINLYGADFPAIRYAEILLSYLESKLEAGDPIDQNLLNQTINLVRGRVAVKMPPVTETDRNKLRVILRRERRVELAFEGHRLFDLLRWRTAHIHLNEPFTGIKITNDPANYTGGWTINEKGYFIFERPIFDENVHYLWPIPQSERDINPNLEQNPGY